MLLLLGLAIPLFFQLVIDKIFPHEGYSTLYVLAVSVGAAILFEAVLGFIRRYLLLYATNRIDIRTAVRTLSRLMLLPVGFCVGGICLTMPNPRARFSYPKP